MLTPMSKSKCHSDVICTGLPQGEMVLLHLGTKRYFTLNATGAKIWNLLQDGAAVEEIAGHLESTYDVSHELALESVTELVADLQTERLLMIEP